MIPHLGFLSWKQTWRSRKGFALITHGSTFWELLALICAHYMMWRRVREVSCKFGLGSCCLLYFHATRSQQEKSEELGLARGREKPQEWQLWGPMSCRQRVPQNTVGPIIIVSATDVRPVYVALRLRVTKHRTISVRLFVAMINLIQKINNQQHITGAAFLNYYIYILSIATLSVDFSCRFV